MKAQGLVVSDRKKNGKLQLENLFFDPVTYWCNQSEQLEQGDHPGMIPVEFGQIPISGSGGEVIQSFNNKVNVLSWSIQWIQQILVLKQNDHLCSLYHSFIKKVFV